MARSKDPYKGTILGKHLALDCPNTADSNNPVFDANPLKWKKAIQEVQKEDAQKIIDLHLALYEHFGIDRFSGVADQELVLSIAFRHEKNLIDKKGRVSLSDLYKANEIDPHKENSTKNLALKLAKKYIPAFQKTIFAEDKFNELKWDSGPGAPLKLGFIETVSLLSLIGFLTTAHKEKYHNKPSVRHLAKYITDTNEAEKVADIKQVETEIGILKNLGNNDRGESRDLSEHAMRSYIKQIKNLDTDIKNLTASKFQRQLYFDVLPWMFKK